MKVHKSTNLGYTCRNRFWCYAVDQQERSATEEIPGIEALNTAGQTGLSRLTGNTPQQFLSNKAERSRVINGGGEAVESASHRCCR